MTSVPVFRSVHFYIGFFILKEPICSPLKFKMANSRHIENRFLAVFFVFLLHFGLRRAAAFVSSPIHLLYGQYRQAAASLLTAYWMVSQWSTRHCPVGLQTTDVVDTYWQIVGLLHCIAAVNFRCMIATESDNYAHHHLQMMICRASASVFDD